MDGDSFMRPQPSSQSIGAGEGEVPLAKPPVNVDVRTMASDLKSMQSSGGGVPRPYTPQQFSPAPSSFTPPAAPSGMPSAQIPPRPAMTPPPIPPRPNVPPAPPRPVMAGGPSAPMPSAPASKPALGVPIPPPKKSGGKGAIIAAAVVVIVLALAAIGYFLIYPIIMGGGASTATPTPEVPAATPPAPEAPAAPSPTPAATATPAAAPLTHASLFVTAAADLNEDIAITAPATLGEIRTKLGFETAEVPILKEIVFRDGAGNQMDFGSVISLFEPTVFSPVVTASFSPDATFFTYTDAQGTWLGVAASVLPTADLAAVKSQVALIESSPVLSNFFLTSPGSPAAAWKSGTTSNVANRYLTWSQAGAGLNYGWNGSTLLLTGSYGSFKEVLKHL